MREGEGGWERGREEVRRNREIEEGSVLSRPAAVTFQQVITIVTQCKHSQTSCYRLCVPTNHIP